MAAISSSSVVAGVNCVGIGVFVGMLLEGVNDAGTTDTSTDAGREP